MDNGEIQMGNLKLETYQMLDDINGEPSMLTSIFVGAEDNPIDEVNTPITTLFDNFINDNSIPSTPRSFTQEHKDHLIKYFDKIAIAAMDAKIAVIGGVERSKSTYSAHSPTETADDNAGSYVTEVKVFRYIRRPSNYLYSNLGGVALLFRFNNRADRNYGGADILYVSFAIASTTDNFSKETGRKLCEQRMDDGGEYALSCFYDRSLSLVDNLKVALSEGVSGKIDPALSTLKRMIDTNCCGD